MLWLRPSLDMSGSELQSIGKRLLRYDEVMAVTWRLVDGDDSDGELALTMVSLVCLLEKQQMMMMMRERDTEERLVVD
jgi:hypothetical protein